MEPGLRPGSILFGGLESPRSPREGLVDPNAGMQDRKWRLKIRKKSLQILDKILIL
jgi:hypothetical protein